MAKFYPVIHVQNSDQVNKNLSIAKSNGADGVFLINHGVVSDSVFKSFLKQAVSQYQDTSFKVGVNFLGSNNIDSLFDSFELGCTMCWADNAGVDQKYILDNIDLIQYYNDFVRLSQLNNKRHVNFFGGVHFKYQPKPSLSLVNSIKLALMHNIIATLSGPATGTPADTTIIKNAFIDSTVNKTDPNLAIASGISIENVDDYLPYIEYFLVASSIIDKSNSRELFDESKLKELCEKIHSYV